jgi:hypothetical protein
VPFTPARRANQAASAQPDGSDAPASYRDAGRGDAQSFFDDASLFDVWSDLPARADAGSISDALFADAALTDTLDAVGEAAGGLISPANLPAQQAAGLIGLVVVAALVHRSENVPIDSRPPRYRRKRLRELQEP